MKEFTVLPDNRAPVPGLFELKDAISKLREYMYISPKDEKRALEAYRAGKQYRFDFVYGFTVGTITAYKD